MHIGFVTTEFLANDRLFPGGLASYLSLTARTLVSLGHSVTVFMLSSRNNTSEYHGIRVVEVAMKVPMPLKPLIILVRKWLPMATQTVVGSWCMKLHLARARQKEGIDLLQYTNYKAIGLFRLKKASLLRVSSYQKMWDNDPHKTTLDKRVCERLERISFSRFGTVIGPGDHLAAVIRRDLRLPHVVRLVPTPVETSARPSERVFRPVGKRMVMYAGTVNRIKGSTLLFAIIREYLALYDDTVFLVAGKPGRSDGLSVLPDLESLTADFPNHFMYHRHLEKADLLAAYGQSDVVLITSLIDNFPNTALEAASQDSILIASETASLGTLLRDGENGFVMTTRSPKSWVEAIRKAFDIDTDTRTRIRNKMRDSLKRHEAETAVRELCRVYREVLRRENV